VQNFGHVATDHPADVNANLVLLRTTRVHEVSSPRHGARSPLHGCATPPLLVPFAIGKQPVGQQDRRKELVNLSLIPQSPPDSSNGRFPAQEQAAASTRMASRGAYASG